MSTGKRLAKRSIIGTRVAAPGNDGKYYTGSIHALKSPASAATEIGLSITSKTRYVVRFDPVPGGRPPSPSTEYARRDLIGPGFGLVSSTSLVPGQKVYLTYNGREIHAEVIEHRKQIEEVDVLIAPNGQEGTMSLTKRIDEIRLLESRKSARLADQDTDFARLADMAGDRKRASSHSIEVPHVPGSRKRRPSSSNDSERSYSGGASGGGASGGGGSGGGSGWAETTRVPHRCGREGCRTNERGDCMDECTAALVLMSLSCSPHSPHHPIPLHCQHNYGSWGGRGAGSVVVGSPGAGGTSNSSSSSSGASWRSGTPSPPLSEEGAPSTGSIWPTPAHHPSHNQLAYPYTASGSSSGSTPGSTGTLDEGIVPDYLEDMHPQKKKIRAWVNRDLVENETCSANPTTVFKCTWPGCLEIKATCDLIEDHVRRLHLGKPKKEKEADAGEDCDMSEGEEEFYYQEVTVDHMSSPPTMSHRDMARPPHEDPEYQKQLRLEAAPVAMISNNTSSSHCNNIINNNNSSSHSNNNTNSENVPISGGVIRDGASRIFAFGVSPSSQQQQQQPQQQQPQQPQQAQNLQQQLQLQQQQQQQQQNTPVKHLKLSPRPLQVCQQNVGLLTVTTGKMPSSPRKVRGETKKCRKIYGMDHRDLWCTQCKWKKACSRFGE